MNNKSQSSAFIPFSIKLAENLKPEAFILFYVMMYYERLGKAQLCFASDATLSKAAGFKKLHTLYKYKNDLIDKGLIFKHTRPHKQNGISTAFQPIGKGLRAGFIFDPQYSPKAKLILAVSALYKTRRTRFIASRLKVSKSLVSIVLQRHCPIYGSIFTNPRVNNSKNACPFYNSKVSKKRHTMYVFKNKGFKLTKEDIYEGADSGTNQDTNAPCKAFSETESKTILDKLNALRIGLDRIDFVKSVLEFYQDEPLEKLIQACFVVFRRRNQGDIASTNNFNYLYGILKNNKGERLIKGELGSSETMQNISHFQQARDSRESQDKATKKLTAVIKRCRETTEEKNQAFWESLDQVQRELIKPHIKTISNLELFNFPDEKTLEIALTTPDFIFKLSEFLRLAGARDPVPGGL